jgi:4-amino-4-deoxy-L-arabinose transferase-like glycosyltransferase
MTTLPVPRTSARPRVRLPDVRTAALTRLTDIARVRLALLGILALAAITYCWDLAANGWANSYYAAAVQAGSQDWVAWFFGSFDAASFITVDKSPAALWVMGLSARLFGLSSWSLLLPEALMGVATVAVLFAAVRRSFGAGAGLLAALVMALTPVAALMFRFDNPDALLTLLLVVAAWALGRGLRDGSLRWAALSGAIIGFAFLTKSLQGYVVLPGFALTWAVAANASIRRRVAGLAVALAAVLVASGWWVAIVELVPASMRPYVGGSTNDSVLDLIFGYNGLARILGGEGPGGGSGGAGGGGGGFGGVSGLLRLFNEGFGGQIAWLVPLSLIALASGLWLHRRAGRTHPAVGGYLLWGSWLLVTGLVFSFMSGIIHEYYTVALAPAVAALVGAGVADLWRRRTSAGALLVLGGAIAVTAALAVVLLARTPDFVPWLTPVVVALAGAAVIGLLAAVLVPAIRRRPAVASAALAIGLVAILLGPAAYTAETATTTRAGSTPLAGPATGQMGGGPGAGGFGGLGGFGGPNGSSTAGSARPTMGGTDGQGGPPAGTVPGAVQGSGSNGATAGSPMGGAVDDALIAYLEANQGGARWIVAVSGANEAAPIQLASGQPVMAMGGFSGSDPTPTLDELKSYVASGELRFVLAGGRGGGQGGGSSDVMSWVTSACTAVDTGSTSGLYDCQGAAS